MGRARARAAAVWRARGFGACGREPSPHGRVAHDFFINPLLHRVTMAPQGNVSAKKSVRHKVLALLTSLQPRLGKVVLHHTPHNGRVVEVATIVKLPTFLYRVQYDGKQVSVQTQQEAWNVVDLRLTQLDIDRRQLRIF